MVKVRLAALDRKLLRDLWLMRGQALAVAAVALCGIATLVSLRSSYEALIASRTSYYAHYRFADVFAGVKRAPETVLARVRAVAGVAEADGRVVVDAALDVPGLAEPASGRLLSLPLAHGTGLNRVFLRTGRLPGRLAAGEVVVSEAFARANGLRPGARFHAVINGRRQMLTVTGIGISPEYINEIKGNSFPDNRRFGVMWMDHEALAYAYDMRGAVNDVSVTLAPGASEPAVIAAIDALLAPYGGSGAYGRSEQISHNFLSNELAQSRVSATVIPAVFLGVAAFLTHNVLLRMTALQRSQIALMKSFGYSNSAVVGHYVKFALATTLAGATFGLALGSWLGRGLAQLYTRFYHFPQLDYSLSAFSVSASLLLAVLTGLAGASLAVGRVLRLRPAEAMRPEAPARFKPGPLERIGLQRYMGLPLRMVLRKLERKPLRALLSVTGLACAVAVTITGQFSFDALDEIIRIQFRIAQRDDLSLQLVEPRDIGAAHLIASMPGVTRVEPYRVARVRLRFRHRVKRTVILGLAPARELRVVLDAARRPVALPTEGVALSDMLARILAIREGDRIAVEFLDGRRRTPELPVTRIVKEPIGAFAYMDIGALARAAGEPVTMTSAYLTADATRLPQLYRQLKGMGALAGATLREATLRSFLDTVGENLRINTVVLVTFACVIAFGVVFNSARIALSEYAVELASLRILGFTQAEAGRLLLGEQAMLTALALPLGCVLGYALAGLIASLLSQELFRIPLVVERSTFGFAIGVVLAASGGSGWLVWRSMRNMNLMEAMKTRE